VKLLALDTSTWVLSAAAGEPGGPISLHEEEVPRGAHSKRLPGALVERLEAAGFTLPELDGLVVGLGPGSFTGLRSGLATLKALAYAAQLPLVGHSSLAALAQAALPHCAEGDHLIPTINARRGQVYAASFRVQGGALSRTGEDEVLDPAALAARLAPGDLLFGDGAEVSPLDTHPARQGALPRAPSAAGLIALCAGETLRFDREAVMALAPGYVRRSEAEEALADGSLKIPGLKKAP